MQHDMLMRGLGTHTQQDYVRRVRCFAAFLGRSPDTATPEDIRRFQLNQHEKGIGPATINGIGCTSWTGVGLSPDPGQLHLHCGFFYVSWKMWPTMSRSHIVDWS